MIPLWRVRLLIHNQIEHLRKLLGGEPVQLTPLGGGTLDLDDVKLAREILSSPEQWYDDAAVIRFQEAFAEWLTVRHAYAFMSGRVALSACLYALDLKPGDEVLLPGYTCVVVPNAMRYAGLVPVYCDIELETYGMDVTAAECALTPRTRAILIHHLYGLVCRDYDALIELANSRGIAVIEDCAHATGARYRGKYVGTRGTVGFFSSEQSKVFNTIQGGMAVTNDDTIAARIQSFWENANQPAAVFTESLLYNVFLNYYRYKAPRRWVMADVAGLLYGEHELVSTSPLEMRGERPPGYGQRMCGAVARLGQNQLAKIDGYNAKRRDGAARWDTVCEERGWTMPSVLPDSEPVYLRYPVLVDPALKQDRSWAAREFRVDLGIWFKSHVHPTSEFVTGCPRADTAVERCVNFPCLP